MRDGTQTRKKLDRCALTLFVKKGITETTIKDIAQKAQIAEGTLYRHYKSKDELAQSLFVSSYAEISEQMKAISDKANNIEQKIQDMVLLFAKKFDEDPILFRYLLLTQHHQAKFLSQEKANAHYFLAELVVFAMDKGQMPKSDPNVSAAIILGIVMQAAVSRVYGRIERKMQEDAELLSQAIIRALNIHGAE